MRQYKYREPEETHTLAKKDNRREEVIQQIWKARRPARRLVVVCDNFKSHAYSLRDEPPTVTVRLVDSEVQLSSCRLADPGGQ